MCLRTTPVKHSSCTIKMAVTLHSYSQSDSKFKCLFTVSVIVRVKWSKYQKKQNKKPPHSTTQPHTTRERCQLISLSFTKTNVGPVGDRRKRCSVHSPNATQMRNYKEQKFQSCLYNSISLFRQK